MILINHLLAFDRENILRYAEGEDLHFPYGRLLNTGVIETNQELFFLTLS